MVINKKILFINVCCCFYNVMSELLRLDEGDKCSIKGINGTCANIFKCPKSKYDISNKDYPPICSFQGRDPIVCCTSCAIYTDYDVRDEVFNPHLGIIRRTDSLAQNKITNKLIRVSGRVLILFFFSEYNEYLNTLDYPCKLHRRSSIEFRVDESQNCYYMIESSLRLYYLEDLYPRLPSLIHTVVLGYGAKFESAQWLCGGSIISERYILTSANCTSRPDLGPVRYVVSGVLNDTTLADPWRRYDVKRVIPHPDYRPDSKYHDIALIETETPITFDVQVLPVSIVATNDHYSFAVGWKDLGQKKRLRETLESVSVANLGSHNDDICDYLYPSQPLLANGFNSKIQICYDFKEKCADGDSGASVVTIDSKACSFAALGVTSIGRSCGKYGGSALYTRVSYYVPWIESVVWPGEKVTNYGTDNRLL